MAAWLRERRLTFSSNWAPQVCRSPHHPNGQLTFEARLFELNGSSEKFLIVHRYGEIRIGEVVEKALQSKLPKLAKTPADSRILLFERDQGWVDEKEIYNEIELRRSQFPQLALVDEIWIADTASFEDKGKYVCFRRSENRKLIESFAFYDGELIEMSKNGIPIPVYRHGARFSSPC